MSVASDINSIIKIKKIKAGLPSLPVQTGITSKKGVGVTDKGSNQGIVSPVTMEIFLDPTPEHTIEANNGNYDVLKAVSVTITDAVGTVIEVDTIIHTVNP